MSTGIDLLDTALRDVNGWLKDMEQQLGSTDRELAYGALKTALHAVRDRIGADNAVHLAAQLPLLLKGAFFQDWEPERIVTRAPAKFVNRADGAAPLRAGDAGAVQAGLAVLAGRLQPAERAKLIQLCPEALRQLWPPQELH